MSYTYKLIEHSNAENLMEEVDAHLKDGWKCQGGAGSSIHFNRYQTYFQAMIHDGKDKQRRELKEFMKNRKDKSW